MAHFVDDVVQGLCVYSLGWQPSIEGEGGKEHFHHLSCERILAWRQLDVHRMGSVPCHSFPALDIDGQEPEIHEPSGRGKNPADIEGVGTDVADVLLGGDRVDYLQGGEHWSGLGVYSRNGTIWHNSGELPLLYVV